MHRLFLNSGKHRIDEFIRRRHHGSTKGRSTGRKWYIPPHSSHPNAEYGCPTRLDGYDKPRAPFILRSHAESNLGVSLQVLWEPGRAVTIMQFVGPGKMILGKGKVLRNFDTPPAGGCRTSVELEIDAPADTRDTKGFHQLFIYGDHMRDFQAYGQMFGIATEHI